MEHATKHVLVPSDMFDRLKSNQELNNRPNKLQTLDGELSDIMRSNATSDYDKALMYQEALKKYLSFRKQNRGPVKLDIVDKLTPLTNALAPPGEPDENDEVTDQELGAEGSKEADVLHLVNSIPKTYQRKAGQILDIILQNGDVIGWNVNNELVYNKETIQGSNIADLLYDVLKQRGKSLDPVGWREFCKGLARINVPEYLIGNPSRRTMIQEYKSKRASGQGWDSDFTSPSPVTNSRKGSKRKSSAVSKSKKIAWERL